MGTEHTDAPRQRQDDSSKPRNRNLTHNRNRRFRPGRTKAEYDYEEKARSTFRGYETCPQENAGNADDYTGAALPAPGDWEY
jgi:hypothetical protein